MARVSIIVPSYNHKKFLNKRLTSILSQTYSDYELIIIDDYSSDGSQIVLDEFVEQNKSKIAHYIKNETNSGSGYNSWKKGIELATTEFIWIAETDDYSHKTFLEKQIEVLEQNSEIALSFTASNYVDSDGVFLYNTDRRTEDLKVKDSEFGIFEGSEFIDKMPFNTYITNGSSVVFRKPKENIPTEVFRHKQISDLFLWTYLIQYRKFSFINSKVNYFRQHANSTTQKSATENDGSYYNEIIDYLNFFKMSDRTQCFTNHYIQHYAWNKKKVLIDFRMIGELENLSRTKYYATVLNFILKKII